MDSLAFLPPSSPPLNHSFTHKTQASTVTCIFTWSWLLIYAGVLRFLFTDLAFSHWAGGGGRESGQQRDPQSLLHGLPVGQLCLVATMISCVGAVLSIVFILLITVFNILASRAW